MIGVSQSSDLELDDVERALLGERISTVLHNPAARSVSRAVSAQTSHERDFLNARILTDLRPVFPDDARGRALAVGILNTLRIDYVESGDLKSMYMSLDKEDLEILGDQIDRARRKGDSLNDLLLETGIPLYEDGDH